MGSNEGLPKPEGTCRFCKRPIYENLAEHENICQFTHRESST